MSNQNKTTHPDSTTEAREERIAMFETLKDSANTSLELLADAYPDTYEDIEGTAHALYVFVTARTEIERLKREAKDAAEQKRESARCSECNGEGENYIDGPEPYECLECDGTGKARP